jgi:uncharacterized protein (DUF2147 family)
MFVRASMLAAATLALSCALGASAAELTPVGHWRTYSDKTGAQTGVIEITQAGDELTGRIVKLISEPGDPADPVCKKCDGPEKDQRVLGMTILKGFKHDGDEWDGGTILDPRTGSVYSSELRLDEDGKKLLVRGYIGISLLGRSVTWIRDE